MVKKEKAPVCTHAEVRTSSSLWMCSEARGALGPEMKCRPLPPLIPLSVIAFCRFKCEEQQQEISVFKTGIKAENNCGDTRRR